MNRPDHEIDAYLEGTLTAEQAPALEEWINASPENAAAFLHLARTHQMLAVVGKERRFSREAEQATTQTFDPVLLTSLAKMEAEAQTEGFRSLDQPFAFESEGKPKREDVGLAQALDDLRWAMGKVGYRLVRSKAVMTGAVAAVLLIALLLIAPWKGSTPDSSTGPFNGPIADDTPDSTTPAIILVATLTGEQNARWAGSALAPGDRLQARQRLTLTQGMAQITTNHGAVAILEAPCTVELTDHDNALRLISGKLVGICETESSKGFLVRAPHMDITDLGTRFGVDATSPKRTDVHIFEGKVEVDRTGIVDVRQELSTGQSARASTDKAQLTMIPQRTETFGVLDPIAWQLPSTGQGLAANQADTNWQIQAVNGKPLDTAIIPIVSDSWAYYRTFPDDQAASKFISWKPPSSPGDGEYDTYIFATSIKIPDELDPDQLQLSARYMADNELAAVVINGHRVSIAGEADIAFDRWRNFTLTDHLVAGHNTIEFEVRNHYAKRFSTAGQVGLRVAWELKSLTTLLEKKNQSDP